VGAIPHQLSRVAFVKGKQQSGPCSCHIIADRWSGQEPFLPQFAATSPFAWTSCGDQRLLLSDRDINARRTGGPRAWRNEDPDTGSEQSVAEINFAAVSENDKIARGANGGRS